MDAVGGRFHFPVALSAMIAVERRHFFDRSLVSAHRALFY
jgi:hypothetical protein